MINNHVMQALRRCPLFAGMSELSIDLALGNISYQLVDYAPRDVYTLAGMPCRFADIVISGSLICRMVSLSGKQVEVTPGKHHCSCLYLRQRQQYARQC